MKTKTIHSGQTLTVPLAVAGTSNLVVDGGYPGLGPGYAMLSGTGTLATNDFIFAVGGLPAYAGASPRGGGTVALSGTLTNKGAIDVGGGQPGYYTKNVSDPGGSGAMFKSGGVLDNAGLILVEGGVTDGPFTASRSGTFELVGVLLNTGSIALDVGSPRLPAVTGAGGGLLVDKGNLLNDGLISLQATAAEGVYPFYESADISIAASGTLSNDGTILLAGAGQAAYAERDTGGAGIGGDGVLINTGLIAFGGGGPGIIENGVDYAPVGAGMTIGSRLANAGTITIAGGAGGGAGTHNGGGGGARVDLSLYTTLTNTGVITIGGGGGSVGPTSSGGGGGLLDAYGTMTNTGVIDCQAGGNPLGANGQAGVDGGIYIGIEDRSATLTNSGTILLNSNAAYPSFYSHSDMVIETRDQLVLSGAGSVLGNGSILNFGTITGTGTVSGRSMINDGSVIAAAGMLALDEKITGHGAFSVAAGASLSLAGSVTIVQNKTIVNTQVVTLSSAGVLDLTSGTAGIEIVTPDGGSATLLGGGTAALYAADTDLTVDLAQASTLTLSAAAFVTAIGSAGNDSLIALAAGQTLTGGAGIDTLTGAAADGDTFRDTAAGLNGDTIAGFAGTDVIDITDLAPGSSLSLSYTQNASYGVLTASEGGRSSTITLTGTFTAGSFTTASDGHGGVLIGLHG